MSKKKKHVRKSFSQTKKVTKENQNNQMWLTITLTIIIVAVAVAVIFIIPNIHSGHNDVISESGNNLTEMAEYLAQKYNDGFSHVGDANGGLSLFYSSKTGEIAVVKSDDFLSAVTIDKSLYSEKYADNGYLSFKQREIVEYYSNLLSMDLGTHRIIIMNDLTVNPSAIQPTTTYKEYAQIIAKLSPMRVLILTDKTLSEDEIAHMNAKINETGIPTMLRVAKYPAELQDNISAGAILAKWSQQDIIIHENINTEYFETENTTTERDN